MSTNQNNSSPRKPTSADIQRQSIRKDIDRESQRNNNAQILGQQNNGMKMRSPNNRTMLAKLRKYLLPLLSKWKHFHYRLEESSREWNRIIFTSFLGIALLSCVWGNFTHPSTMVANTKIGTERTFINQDTIKLTGERYDRNNGTLRADFTTNSQSGAISSKELSAHFVLANKPSHNGAIRPTLNLVPTFNNHFTVVIHHLYKGFGGVALMFHNKSALSVSSLANAGDDNNTLTQKQSDEVQNAAQNGSSYSGSQKVDKLIQKLEKQDNSNFVLGENQLIKGHKLGYLNGRVSPKSLAMSELKQGNHNDMNDIKGDENYIKQDKGQLKSDQNKIRQINRGADVGNKGHELEATKSQSDELRASLANYGSHIKRLKADIQENFHRMQLLKTDVSVLPKTQTPQPGKLFSNNAH